MSHDDPNVEPSFEPNVEPSFEPDLERDLETEAILGKALAAPREVPPEWRVAAQAAFTWRTVDEELLALVHDSAADGVAAVRGDAEARTLAFSGGGLTLEVELADRRIQGQLDGDAASPGMDATGEVTFEHVDGRTRSATTDETGFFTLAGEDHGLVRFAVRTAGTRLVTEWIVL
ncbi:hypothetical protein [Nocardioides bigeumensis]|uniref:Carboxypeptidase regulatory-like domain-containing protein n=1 Tax=Nocardioides bigeumensis TaxID=433657 RepID=A0ABP5JY04_9ACTN